MSEKVPITVVVPVKNEAAHLGACLARLSRFSEVIVVDSLSGDRTADVAREHCARLINFEWNGRYPKKRNWLLLNHQLANEWVLFLDADELVNEAFCNGVDKAVRAGNYDGFWLSYINYFLGRPLRHGVPQRKLALFRVGKGLFEQIGEDHWTQLDMEVHEHPIIEGEVGKIDESIEHNDDRGIVKFIDRHCDYAVWEARRVELLLGDESALAKLTSRQRFKYRHISKWWYPWFYFCYSYVVKVGFLDGGPGFFYAFYKLWYFQSIRLLIAQRKADQFRLRAEKVVAEERDHLHNQGDRATIARI